MKLQQVSTETAASNINSFSVKIDSNVPGGSLPVTDTAYTPGLKVPGKQDFNKCNGFSWKQDSNKVKI